MKCPELVNLLRQETDVRLSGAGECRAWKGLTSGYRTFFGGGGDKNILKLDFGDGA